MYRDYIYLILFAFIWFLSAYSYSVNVVKNCINDSSVKLMNGIEIVCVVSEGTN